jgi:hypothetical protein
MPPKKKKKKERKKKRRSSVFWMETPILPTLVQKCQTCPLLNEIFKKGHFQVESMHHTDAYQK